MLLQLSKRLTDEQAAALAGTMLDESAYDVLLTETAEVRDADTGALVLKFAARALPLDACASALAVFGAAGVVGGTRNRGIATAKAVTGHRPVRRDGVLSNTRSTPTTVASGIVGFFDRNARYPFCRQTAFNMRKGDRFERAMPFVRAVADVFEREVPDRFAVQADWARRTHPDFVIRGTPFTTITVNHNWQTAVHTDSGDLKDGFGVLTALRDGAFGGCFFVLPAYRVAVDMQNADVLLVDVHQWHGNTPFRPLGKGAAKRVSCVFYYRRHMIDCGSAEDELERAKRRRRGDKLRPAATA